MRPLYIVPVFCFLCFLGDSNGALETLDDFSFQTFLKLFRTDLLNNVGQQWNVTIAQALILHKQMGECHGKIQTRIDACQNCTIKLCKTQPSFRRYLDIVDPTDSIQKPLEQVGSTLYEVVDLLGTQSFTFLDAMKGIAETTGAALGHEFEGAYNKIKGDFARLPHIAQVGGQFALDKFSDLGKLTLGGLTDFGNSIGNGFTDLGNSIYHGFSEQYKKETMVLPIWSQGPELNRKDLFGRRRRKIDEATRLCMNSCDDVCWEFLTDNNDDVITNVCGAPIVGLNKTVHHNIDRVMSMYNATLDTTKPIVTKVEIDRSSMDPKTLSINTVYITANLRGTELRYQSSVPFNFMDIPTTSKGMVREFTRMWK